MDHEAPVTSLTLVHAGELSMVDSGETLRSRDIRLQQLEYENACLKQAMHDLMMEKLLLKCALESRCQQAPEQIVDRLCNEAARDASQRAREASAFVKPGKIGSQLRSAFADIANEPVPDAIAELIRRIERQRTRTSRLSLEHVLSLLRA
jgi:hypothetical protein